jgi:hypothetical protein
VQEHVRQRLALDAAAIDLDDVVRADDRVQLPGSAVHEHTTGAYELVCAAPRGDSGTREEGIQAHGGILPPVGWRA